MKIFRALLRTGLMFLLIVPAVAAGDLSISPGANFSLGSSTFSLSGDWENDGTYTAGTGVVVFNGDGSRTITGANAFYDLVIDKTNAVDAVDASGSDLSVTNTLSVAGGILTSASAFGDVAIAPPGTLALSGDITVSGQWQNRGTFIHNNYTVRLNGIDQSMAGANLFYNLTKQTASAATLTFESNAATTIENDLVLGGAAGQLLALRASSPGVRWDIDPRGGRFLDYLDVQDSENINLADIDVIGRHCLDSGNNVKWVFLADMTMAVLPTSAGSTTPAAGSVTMVEGGLAQNITAAVDHPDYHFFRWTAEPVGNAAFDDAFGPATTVTLSGPAVITANFAVNVYTLTYLAGPNGAIDGYNRQPVASGGSGLPVTALAAAGYHFVGWSDGAAANPRTDTNVTADRTVTAAFALNTYTLTYAAGPGGSIMGATPQTVNHGADGAPVTAVAGTGFRFVRWSDGVGGPNRTDIGITSDFSALAEFEAVQPDLPDDLDLDGNGQPDEAQTDITVAPDGNGRYFGLIVPPEMTTEYLEWIDAALVPDTTNRPDRFPLGLVRFRVLTSAPGETIQLTIYCSEAIPEGVFWFTHDPVNGWQDYSEGAVVGQDRRSVTLTLQDGGFGDADGEVNGVIEGVFGPALFDQDDGNDDDDNGNDGNQTGDGKHHGGGCFLETAGRH